MRVLIVVNPTAGRGRAGRVWPAVAAELDRCGIEYEPHFTTGPKDATSAARSAAGRGYGAVVAAGGDGTLTEVVNGLVGSGCAFGVLPMGSGNDFARTAGVALDPVAAARQLASAVPRPVDLGRAGERYFVNVASAGMDAEIANLMNVDLRWLSGAPAYVAATFWTLARFRSTLVRLELDGAIHRLPASLVAVGNGRFYGGGMMVTPGASLDDGLFDVCVLGAMGRAEFLREFPSVYRGQHLSHPKVSIFRARKVTLQTEPEGRYLVQADGEILGRVPREFTVEPGALPFLGPDRTPDRRE